MQSAMRITFNVAGVASVRIAMQMFQKLSAKSSSRCSRECSQNIGAFTLWALCNYWGGPKKVVYNSEPDPASIEDAAEELQARPNPKCPHYRRACGFG